MSTNQADDLRLDALAASLAASPVPVTSIEHATPATELWSRGRARRRRRNALTVAASVVAALAVGTAGISLLGPDNENGRQTQQLAAPGSNDLVQRAQDALGPRWTLTSQQTPPARATRPTSSSGFVYFGDASKNVTDVQLLGFTEDAAAGAQPYPNGGNIRIESARYSQPTPDQEQVAAYARLGGPASHYPDDGTRATVLLEQTPTADSHVWVVEMPDKNSLIALVWQRDGRVTHIIEPGGDAPPLAPSAIAALGAALARA